MSRLDQRIVEQGRAESVLRDLLAVESGLSEKEIDFIDSVDKWRGMYRLAQIKWLDDIWGRVCG